MKSRGEDALGWSDLPKGILQMNVTTLNRSPVGEPLLPHVTQRTRSRLISFLFASGLANPDPRRLEKKLRIGFYADEEVKLLVAATGCSRPLLCAETETLARALELNLILMRFDPDRGVAFDILLSGANLWYHDFAAWRRGRGAMWLIPENDSAPFFQISKLGLTRFNAAPFSAYSDRVAGMIRAIEFPSFSGGQ